MDYIDMISIDQLFTEDHARFSTVPFKLLFAQQLFIFENFLFLTSLNENLQQQIIIF